MPARTVDVPLRTAPGAGGHMGPPSVKTIQAYRFALDLTPGQERDVLAHAGAARVAHNWALARVMAVMDQRAAERTYRWRKAANRLGRAHARVGNLRRDGLHKLTTRLASEHGTVVVEDLNVAGMLTGRRLARHIADAGFAEIRRQLAYKTAWNGGRMVVADRWYPSSKTCSGCGLVKAKLALSEREYPCETCGLVMDRDVNAARNLAALAAQLDTAGSGSVAARGADRKPRPGGQVAVKREPGTASTGQTGTVPPQGGTAARVLT
ncbi:RNA-guided endonuclease TnpB family protein [Spongiactinospora sp. TRM90649]|uniref:RNA-guided endonuclease TnpB family protein n=1 Tax=Spongiactinospora sp. TRM90649 TaxID=3031114 RepID=UPI0023F74CBC|nr:RNA-guided endonuclease TnpB family protein [Spongiactinospora sp. TRM90649]MDF5757712.1 RNA-guided endonuclease TnpB family protein [Spongiactinospora sp. TRM90649]